MGTSTSSEGTSLHCCYNGENFGQNRLVLFQISNMKRTETPHLAVGVLQCESTKLFKLFSSSSLPSASAVGQPTALKEAFFYHDFVRWFDISQEPIVVRIMLHNGYTVPSKNGKIVTNSSVTRHTFFFFFSFWPQIYIYGSNIFSISTIKSDL